MKKRGRREAEEGTDWGRKRQGWKVKNGEEGRKRKGIKSVEEEGRVGR